MKAGLFVEFTGITEEDLLKALQGLRDVEQRAPDQVHMSILVRAEEMSTEHVQEMLNKVQPPMPEQVVLRKGVSIVDTLRRGGPETRRL